MSAISVYTISCTCPASHRFSSELRAQSLSRDNKVRIYTCHLNGYYSFNVGIQAYRTNPKPKMNLCEMILNINT